MGRYRSSNTKFEVAATNKAESKRDQSFHLHSSRGQKSEVVKPPLYGYLRTQLNHQSNYKMTQNIEFRQKLTYFLRIL